MCDIKECGIDYAESERILIDLEIDDQPMRKLYNGVYIKATKRRKTSVDANISIWRKRNMRRMIFFKDTEDNTWKIIRKKFIKSETEVIRLFARNINESDPIRSQFLDCQATRSQPWTYTTSCAPKSFPLIRPSLDVDSIQINSQKVFWSKIVSFNNLELVDKRNTSDRRRNRRTKHLQKTNS